MQQRGRKSAASLSVVAGTIDGRPKPPPDLNKEQSEIWNRVVASEAADLFKTAAVQRLLCDFCRHSSAVEILTAVCDQALLDPPPKLSDLDRLLKMRERETRAAMSIATKLRLTNQSRYQPSTAAVKASGVTERKLWQRA